MIKVITYGTYDLLHYGHIRLLERAKALGDYLIVGVTADGFDRSRGKINVQQSLMERIEAVQSTGLADEIIVEEYDGQKIDDVQRYEVDIFAVGSDWEGQFDYLNEYCKVVYLDRTKGISSSQLRENRRSLRLGLVGESEIILKVLKESNYVNGIQPIGYYSEDDAILKKNNYFLKNDLVRFSRYEQLLDNVDAVYIISMPNKHFKQIKLALEKKVHVLCESPITLDPAETSELFKIAEENKIVLMESIKTAYSTAYHRMILLVKSGIIGNVISIDSTCTSIRDIDCTDKDLMSRTWNSICAWGPTAMLPIFQIFGVDYLEKNIISYMGNEDYNYDLFTQINYTYAHSVASIKIGQGVKSEGDLVISGSKGYVYVPAPWWKTEYFEVRYENTANNRRYFYQLDGEGIRYMLVSFMRKVESKSLHYLINREISIAISDVISDFENNKNKSFI